MTDPNMVSHPRKNATVNLDSVKTNDVQFALKQPNDYLSFHYHLVKPEMSPNRAWFKQNFTKLTKLKNEMKNNTNVYKYAYFQ